MFSGVTMISLLLSLVCVSPVQAVPPIPFVNPIPDQIRQYNCGEFYITDYGTVKEEGQTFLDQDGNPIRTQVTVNFTDHLYRAGSTLEVFSETHWTGGYGYDENGVMISAWGHGNIFFFKVPGLPPLLHETGYMFLDLITWERRDTGLNDWITANFEGICQYFAGE